MDNNRYPIHDIMKQYLPIDEIKDYYEGISVEEVKSLIAANSVGYAELKKGKYRVPHVNMLDVLRCLGRDLTLHHLENRGGPDE